MILFCIICLVAGCGIGLFCMRHGSADKPETEAISEAEMQAKTAAQTETDPVPEKVSENEAATEKMTGTEAVTEAVTEAQTREGTVHMTGEAGEIDRVLASMPLEDKVAQLFIVLPEQLTGSSLVTAAGEMTRAAFDAIPAGGMIYMEPNLESAQQIEKMLAGMQDISLARTGLPAFLCVDEEGGSVSRVNGRGIVDSEYIGDMADIGASGDVQAAYDIGYRMGTYLSELGFNVDFAPCADVLTNPENTVVSRRSFGADPFIVSSMCEAVMNGLHARKMMATYKHFPGHGATSGDTHTGMAHTDKTLEAMMSTELVPFQSAIDLGCDMIMVGHISAPAVTGDDTPASMSKIMVTDVLRERMGYQGLVVTDAMNMDAIARNYSSAQAAIASVKAGVDLILMPEDLTSAYSGLLQAVRDGEITEERIDESVRRILEAKQKIVSG